MLLLLWTKIIKGNLNNSKNKGVHFESTVPYYYITLFRLQRKILGLGLLP